MLSHQLFQDRESRQGNKITQVLGAGRQEKNGNWRVVWESKNAERKDAVLWHRILPDSIACGRCLYKWSRKRGQAEVDPLLSLKLRRVRYPVLPRWKAEILSPARINRSMWSKGTRPMEGMDTLCTCCVPRMGSLGEAQSPKRRALSCPCPGT